MNLDSKVENVNDIIAKRKKRFLRFKSDQNKKD